MSRRDLLATGMTAAMMAVDSFRPAAGSQPRAVGAKQIFDVVIVAATRPARLSGDPRPRRVA
jgi:hypothetical protein